MYSVKIPEYPKIALTITYNGSNFCGWQVQKNAVSVQQTMQDALEMTLGFRPDLCGCSRTDSGVHANNYVCHLSAENVGIEPERLARALNSRLHGTGIAVKSAEYKEPSFHARYSCVKKEYVYKIWNAPYENPFLCGLAWHFPYKINERELDFVGEEFAGTHDFTAFMSKGSKITDDTVRTVEYFKTVRSGDLVEIYVCADGFLYNMVRIMVGTFILASAGKIEKGGISAIINSKDRSEAGDTAPAHGLYLNRVFY